ncbi:MAG TPA: AAA family ATPase [Acidimicrobiales bacterium]|nr:AAA family ATPase [Acidimicrobiales bacterium]
MSDPTFLTRVKIKNYKSIAACDVALGPLNFLVGPNGAGKSNFLDALRFVTDALTTTLDHAFRNRGRIHEVCSRSSENLVLGLRLEFSLSPGITGHYAFEIEGRSLGGFAVRTEQCLVRESLGGGHFLDRYYMVESGTPTGTVANLPPASSDRLYLVTASGLPAFRPVFDALTRMAFYNVNPDRMREIRPTSAETLLARDGASIATVVRHLSTNDLPSMLRIQQYLAAAVPGITQVSSKSLEGYETVEFHQRGFTGWPKGVRFGVANMSDGTLRALGVLVALFQSGNDETSQLSLVGIEEPEAALHPFAVGVLLDALREASESTQVLVTSHSPDLLDDPEIGVESLLAVAADGGFSIIGPVSEADRSVIRDRLFTPGELLRTDQLLPEPSTIERPEMNLFDTIDA